MLSWAVWPRAPGRGAGGHAATPTTPAPVPPGPAGPTPPSAAAPAPRGRSAGSAAAPLRPPAGPPRPIPDGGQRGQGEQAECDVPMPPDPTADLVLVEPALPLGPLEPLLDGPPQPRHPDELPPRGVGRAAAQVVGPLAGPLPVPADQQPQ